MGEKQMTGKYSKTPKDKIAIEIFRCIKRGEANNRTQLSRIFGKSTKTIGKYINSLRNSWNVDVDYDESLGKYVIYHDGDLKGYAASALLTKDDINLILYTLIQSRSFMPSKINLIQNSLLSILPTLEAEELKQLIPQVSPAKYEDDPVICNIQTIREAITEQKKISFNYIAQSSESFKAHKVIPYSFAWDLGKYYMIAQTDHSKNLLHFRIDRMRSVVKLDEPGLRSESFNVEQYLKRTWYMYSGEETRVRVRFKKDAYKVVTERNMSDGRIVEGPDEKGDFVYEFVANGTDGILWWILGFGGTAEILEPIELRERAIEIIKKMSGIYNIR